MQAIAVSTKNSVKRQTKTLVISPDDRSMALKIKIEWRRAVQKWFMTVWSVQSGQCIISNIPLLCSCEYANDLLGQFRHMRIGSSFVATSSDQLYGVDPYLDNIAEYELIWKDGFD